MFQSSPAPKSRCNAIILPLGSWYQVSILTGSEEPVQPSSALSALYIDAVSILTGSEEPVQLFDAICSLVARDVSILTGSEEPVQREYTGLWRQRFIVSILTGSEEPVQLSSPLLSQTHCHCFNPHRLRRAGATQFPTT